MLQEIVTYIGSLNPVLIYIVLFFFSFIENIFPPSPSDLVVVVGATLIANSAFGFLPILILTSIGSSAGFITMYYIGDFLGEKLVRSGRVKFIRAESIEKADRFFHKHGYNLIIINRFFPGTRAVVSFFSGVHKLKTGKTFFYAFISSFFWNILLISLGVILGKNITLVDAWLKNYSQIAIIVTAGAVIILFIRFIIKKKRKDEIQK